MDSHIDPSKLVSPLRHIDCIFDKAGFNDMAMFGLLRKALTDIPDVLQFVIYRGASEYKTMKMDVHEYVTSRRTFVRQVTFTEAGPSEVFGSKKVLNRTDTRVAQIESKVDSLANDLANLSLLVQNKTTAAREAAPVTDQDRTCSFCKEKCHSTNRCQKNPYRDHRCKNYSKMGHSAATCWSKKKPAKDAPVAPVAASPAAAAAAVPAPAAPLRTRP